MPDTKAPIQERDSAAHQKHNAKFIAEEDKQVEAQIKKYEAILPKAIDIDQTTVEFLRDFFYKHPTLALAY